MNQGDINNSMRNQIYIYIELPRFKYEDFDGSKMLHKWLAFLKSVRVTSENIKDKDIENRNIKNENIEGENVEEIIEKKKDKGTIKIDIPFKVYKEIIKEEVIKESFEICERKLEGFDENQY